MFDRFLTCPHALARHRNGPLAAERRAYLTHLADAGLSQRTMQTAADYILVAADRLGLAGRPGESISREEIQRCATRWANRSPRTARRKRGRPSQFQSRAIRWLDFLGRLKQPPSSPNPYGEQIAAFGDYMRSDRGFSPQTIRKQCQFVQRFLDRFRTTGCLRAITVTEIDGALMEMVAAGRCARVTVRNFASNLRAFFRYAEMRGWCRSGMAGAIQGPRVFAQESLPSGASWADVQQVLAASQRDRPSDIRDHAILMLLAIYGLRGGEVRTLRLEDFDWERELLFVAGSKTRRTRRYPLSRPVGEAILRYLKEVRPRSLHRNLFLTLHPPFRPLTDLWPVVGKRLRPLAASLRHHGPHALRHACATHLMAEGHSLKEIGDYLGHRNLDSTRIYASRGYVATAPLPTVIPKQPPRFVPYIYSHDDLRRLLQTVDSSQRDQARLEPVTTHMIILLLYGTGLRVSEATRLNRVDVDLEDSLLTIRHTKFHKSRFVPFGPQLGRALARYAARAPLSAAEAPFFTMRTGSRVVPDTLEGHFRSFCTRAGVRRKDESRYQPRLHDLRHSFAVHRLTAWYREGADVQQLLPQLSVYMGHGSLRGTQVYLSMTAELLREANRRFAQYAGKEAEHD